MSRVRAHVALRDERAVERRAQLLDGVGDPLTLIGESQARPLLGETLGDRPRDRSAVGNAKDESPLALEEPSHTTESNRWGC